MIKWLNDILTGFRTIIAILAPIGIAYIDAVSTQLTGVTPREVKIAALASIIPTLKLIWTDARPKIQSWVSK